MMSLVIFFRDGERLCCRYEAPAKAFLDALAHGRTKAVQAQRQQWLTSVRNLCFYQTCDCRRPLLCQSSRFC